MEKDLISRHRACGCTFHRGFLFDNGARTQLFLLYTRRIRMGDAVRVPSRLHAYLCSVYCCWRNIFRDILCRNTKLAFGAFYGQQAWRIVYLCGDRYEHIDRQNDAQPFASAYAAGDHTRHAHFHVLCAHAQRGDRSRARGDEDARRRQRSQSKDIIQGFSRTVRHEARQHFGHARAVRRNARLYAGRQPVFYL